MEFFNSCPELVQIAIISFGLFTIIIFIMLILNLLFTGIKNLWHRLVYYIHRKTRFHRHPTAKCYCRDCENWHPHECKTEGTCWAHYQWTTADEWFCWDATPSKTERNDI